MQAFALLPVVTCRGLGDAPQPGAVDAMRTPPEMGPARLGRSQPQRGQSHPFKADPLPAACPRQTQNRTRAVMLRKQRWAERGRRLKLEGEGGLKLGDSGAPLAAWGRADPRHSPRHGPAGTRVPPGAPSPPGGEPRPRRALHRWAGVLGAGQASWVPDKPSVPPADGCLASSSPPVFGWRGHDYPHYRGDKAEGPPSITGPRRALTPEPPSHSLGYTQAGTPGP